MPIISVEIDEKSYESIRQMAFNEKTSKSQILRKAILSYFIDSCMIEEENKNDNSNQS